MKNLDELLIGEDDFPFKMENIILPWAKEEVKDSYFTATDGASLHYHYAFPKDKKAVIIMVHGFCEFYPKYHEMTYYFYKMGYAFFFLEQRGHGYSRRYVDEKDKVTVDSYESYVQDLLEFINFVVDKNKDAAGLKKFLFAHSMGGAVSSYFMIKNKGYINAAVLSSPMIKVNTGGLPLPLINFMMLLSVIFRFDKKYVPGQGGFTGIEDYDNSSTLSRNRFHYIFNERVKDENYQTWGGTYEWTRASLKACGFINKHLDGIDEDILLFRAGKDVKVDNSGIESLMEKGKNISFFEFKDSKHEIFNSTFEDRKRYYELLFDFYERHL